MVVTVVVAATVGTAGDLKIEHASPSGELDLSAVEDRDGYYILTLSDDLKEFSPLAVDFGSPAPVWELDGLLNRRRGFFSLQRHRRDDPVDTDGDGIDDVWELEHEDILNPLNPDDAKLDPDGDGTTYLGEYLREKWGRGVRGNQMPSIKEVYSREVTVFNLGEPAAFIEAISQEVSVYNGEVAPNSFIRNVQSREFTVFNLGEPTAFIEAISAEVSVFNFGSAPSRIEAISRELSVYNGEVPPTGAVDEAYSRELSVFNFGQASAPREAISREVSVFNQAE